MWELCKGEGVCFSKSLQEKPQMCGHGGKSRDRINNYAESRKNLYRE